MSDATEADYGADQAAYGTHRLFTQGLRGPIATLVRECLQSTVTEWGSSRESDFRRCPQLHHLAHVEHIKPHYQRLADPSDDLDVRPEYFDLGQIVHAGLGMLHKYRLHPCEVTEYLMQDVDGGTDLGLVVEAERLLLAYCGHWDVLPTRGMLGWEDCTVKDVEVLVRDDSTFALPMTRRLDLVLEVGPRKRLTIVDHKTRGTRVPDGRTKKQMTRSEFAHSLSVSPAALGQVHCAMKYYGLTSPPDIMFNYIIKLKKVPKFARVTVEIDPAKLAEWIEIRQLESEVQRRTIVPPGGLTGLLPVIPNWDACYPMMGSPCRYTKWCHGTPEQRERHYIKEEPQP